MAEHPRGVKVHTPGKGTDSSDFGRQTTKGGRTPATGTEAERVAATVIPEKRGVREPDQKFPAPASIDPKRDPRGP